jgi:hypothetical protein
LDLGLTDGDFGRTEGDFGRTEGDLDLGLTDGDFGRTEGVLDLLTDAGGERLGDLGFRVIFLTTISSSLSSVVVTKSLVLYLGELDLGLDRMLGEGDRDFCF